MVSYRYRIPGEGHLVSDNHLQWSVYKAQFAVKTLASPGSASVASAGCVIGPHRGGVALALMEWSSNQPSFVGMGRTQTIVDSQTRPSVTTRLVSTSSVHQRDDFDYRGWGGLTAMRQNIQDDSVGVLALLMNQTGYSRKLASVTLSNHNAKLNVNRW